MSCLIDNHAMIHFGSFASFFPGRTLMPVSLDSSANHMNFWSNKNLFWGSPNLESMSLSESMMCPGIRKPQPGNLW